MEKDFEEPPFRFADHRLELTAGTRFGNQSAGQFLDAFRQSRKNRYLLLQNHQLERNHVPVRSLEEIIQPQDLLSITCPPQPLGFLPAAEPCRIVYEDDLVYVAHKDAHRIIHGDPQDTDCLAAQAAAWQLQKGIDYPVRYIHRLDEGTQGLVLFVKFPFFQPWFDAMLEGKQIQRHYLAITTGSAVPGRKFTFRQPIGRDRHVSGRYRISPTGKEACTLAECIAVKDEYLEFSCRLETGRTHQIRVHLSASGFPIVNDPLYGVPSQMFQEMGLWADQIIFPDPVTGGLHTVQDLDNPDFHCFPGKTAAIMKNRKNKEAAQ
jgi:23S rRNA pseudouridine1911/1915/1917 synthase